MIKIKEKEVELDVSELIKMFYPFDNRPIGAKLTYGVDLTLEKMLKTLNNEFNTNDRTLKNHIKNSKLIRTTKTIQNFILSKLYKEYGLVNEIKFIKFITLEKDKCIIKLLIS